MEVILFFTGLVVALIGTLAGSGGLIGMPVMLLLGLPIHTAIATSKFFKHYEFFFKLCLFNKRSKGYMERMFTYSSYCTCRRIDRGIFLG
ncbi:MAG: hypothetical protein ACQEU4_02085 [Bacillota bacterium]